MENEKRANPTNTIKAAFEIGALAGQLNQKNQSYVLNTINALLFAQQSIEGSGENARQAGGIFQPKNSLHH